MESDHRTNTKGWSNTSTGKQNARGEQVLRKRELKGMESPCGSLGVSSFDGPANGKQYLVGGFKALTQASAQPEGLY